MSTTKLSWLEYFAWADPDLPYMRLFRGIVQVAYVALGGDVVDQCLAGARSMDEDYRRDQALAQSGPPEDPPDPHEKRRPVGHREGAGARRDCWKYEQGRRKRFEEACELVRKLFRSVLGHDAVLPHEPEETREHKPEDPEMVKRIQARAANLEALHPPARPSPEHFPPGGPPVDADAMRTILMLRQQLREANVYIEEMQRTIVAMQRDVAGGVSPEEGRPRAVFEDAARPGEEPVEPSSQTAPARAAREEGPFTKLIMSDAEPTADTLAIFPAQEHHTIRKMWQRVQESVKLGVPRELIRSAVQGDMQARQEVDRLLEQAQPTGA